MGKSIKCKFYQQIEIIRPDCNRYYVVYGADSLRNAKKNYLAELKYRQGYRYNSITETLTLQQPPTIDQTTGRYILHSQTAQGDRYMRGADYIDISNGQSTYKNYKSEATT